jgi:Fe-S oxidoreductase
MLIGEFADRRNLTLPQLEGKVVFHGHCHQKAVLEVEAARNVLRKMGLEIEEPQPGCCGMAGSFGFEKRHYDLSMKIAEEHLLPAARQAGHDTLIVADGFSCRTQIFDGTGRMPMHMAELFKYAFEHGIEAPGQQEERIAA